MGRITTMTDDAIQNYGNEWFGVQLEITHTATACMPASEFFATGSPDGYHPGFDAESGRELYTLRRVDNGEYLPFSLYDWEIN